MGAAINNPGVLTAGNTGIAGANGGTGGGGGGACHSTAGTNSGSGSAGTLWTGGTGGGAGRTAGTAGSGGVTLYTLEVVNDGAGNVVTGNYHVRLLDVEGYALGVARVEKWPRLERNALQLVVKALAALETEQHKRGGIVETRTAPLPVVAADEDEYTVTMRSFELGFLMGRLNRRFTVKGVAEEFGLSMSGAYRLLSRASGSRRVNLVEIDGKWYVPVDEDWPY